VSGSTWTSCSSAILHRSLSASGSSSGIATVRYSFALDEPAQRLTPAMPGLCRQAVPSSQRRAHALPTPLALPVLAPLRDGRLAAAKEGDDRLGGAPLSKDAARWRAAIRGPAVVPDGPAQLPRRQARAGPVQVRPRMVHGQALGCRWTRRAQGTGRPRPSAPAFPADPPHRCRTYSTSVPRPASLRCTSTISGRRASRPAVGSRSYSSSR
jgi:hypothetical protein